jgi:hypothetical protein
MFRYEDGWAASHCQMGALAPMQALVFDWLERAIDGTTPSEGKNLGELLDVFMRHAGRGALGREAELLVNSMRAEGGTRDAPSRGGRGEDQATA